MFTLTQRNFDTYKWHGVEIDLNLSFDNVLLLFELFEDEEMTYELKLDIALEMLVVNSDLLKQLNVEQAIELILDVLKEKLDIDLRIERDKEVEPTIPTFDWHEDAERIYASFLFDYNIDLFEQQGRLHWHKFLALFRNLSENSPMGQALHYRTCELPPKDKYNTEERKRIKKMKEHYELKCAKELIEQKKAKEFEESLKRMKAMQRKE